mgnify:CR=1 FL=1|tara:strand:+ start:738 stop:1235 length:498 start_codon:yes stop_codon:yes gene_type:complete
MWTIVKIDKKKFPLLKEDFQIKLGKSCIFYCPKFLFQKYRNNKLLSKEFDLLGDYFLCFHKDFIKPETINKLKYSRGLKYFLSGFYQSQKEIEIFVRKCKDSENSEGYLSQNFYPLKLNQKYKFSSGPFVEKIFKIINLQKNKIDIYIGNIKTSIQKQDFLFKPV